MSTNTRVFLKLPIHPNRLLGVVLAISPVVVLSLVVCSVLYGSQNLSATDVWNALIHYDSSDLKHQIILHSRLPRALGALLVGLLLAVSGAIMQGITRNDLASPSLLGVSDGSVFAVTLCMVFAPSVTGTGLLLVSMAGSALGAALVFGMAALIPKGSSPVTLAILGIITGMFLNGVSDAIALYNHIPQKISFWYNARLYQIVPEQLQLVWPYVAAGLLLALLLSRFISVLALGEEISAALGQRAGLIKAGGMLAVALLTGIAVAIAGKIAFVGLIIPHVARMLIGSDYRRIIPLSGVLGAVFLGLCDMLSRYMNAPFETPIGVVMALFGVPFFLYLIRRKKGEEIT